MILKEARSREVVSCHRRIQIRIGTDILSGAMSSNEETTNLQPGVSSITRPPRPTRNSMCPLPVHIGLINDMIKGAVPNEEAGTVGCETHMIPHTPSCGVSNLTGEESRAPESKTLISLANMYRLTSMPNQYLNLALILLPFLTNLPRKKTNLLLILPTKKTYLLPRMTNSTDLLEPSR